MSKYLAWAMVTILFYSVTYAGNKNKISHDFTSKLGYSITLPSCITAAPNNYDDDAKNLESLSSIALTHRSECENKNKTIMSITESTRYKRKPPHENFDQIIKDAKLNNELRSENNLAMERIILKSGEAVLITKKLGAKALRWQIWLYCNDKLFLAQITTESNFPAPDPLFTAIKKDPNFIPEPEKSVIESFKCIVK